MVGWAESGLEVLEEEKQLFGFLGVPLENDAVFQAGRGEEGERTEYVPWCGKGGGMGMRRLVQSSFLEPEGMFDFPQACLGRRARQGIVVALTMSHQNREIRRDSANRHAPHRRLLDEESLLSTLPRQGHPHCPPRGSR